MFCFLKSEDIASAVELRLQIKYLLILFLFLTSSVGNLLRFKLPSVHVLYPHVITSDSHFHSLCL